VRLCDAIAVTAVCRDPAAAAAGAPYRLLGQIAPALAARMGASTDAVLRLEVGDVASLASEWAAECGMGEDLADTLALAWPRVATDANKG
jgi:hypothetical protein